MSNVDWEEFERASNAIRDMAKSLGDKWFFGTNLDKDQRAAVAASIWLEMKIDGLTAVLDRLEKGPRP